MIDIFLKTSTDTLHSPCFYNSSAPHLVALLLQLGQQFIHEDQFARSLYQSIGDRLVREVGLVVLDNQRFSTY